MIEWGSFVIVAVASLVGACLLVTIAALGIRLFEAGTRARGVDPRTGRLALAGARALFGVCGAVVLFGVYLIVPALH
ncbi:hypothetical protein GCM10022239_22770 [Leifsonia bigeumensis]|uniref:Uncharacterized protein n=1 Tax=Leifsonella bigeumensis TaxID=433643 RepID=A0ABP7FT61_9MICO